MPLMDVQEHKSLMLDNITLYIALLYIILQFAIFSIAKFSIQKSRKDDTHIEPA